MDGRVYQPNDIKKILERATILQQTAIERDTRGGLTLAELEDVASSSGIDPTFIQQAALELSLPDGAADSSSSTHLLIERVVRGELTDDRWTAILIELRRRFEVDGEDSTEVVESHGATKCWRHVEDDEITTQVYVTPRQGTLHIKMSQKIAWADRVTESTVWSVVASAVLGTLVAGQVDTMLLSILSYVTTFVVAFMAIYGIETHWRKSKKRDFDLLADSLTRTLASSATVSSVGLDVPRTSTEPELEIDELDDQREYEASATRTRRSGRSR